MASAMTAISKPAPGHWRIAWSGTAPFWVYRDGRAVLTSTTLTEFIFQNKDDEEPPFIEVRDSTESESTIQQLQHQPFATIQWFQSVNAKEYIVQRLLTDTGIDTWETLRVVLESGHGYYTVATPVLDDVTEYTYRVLAKDDQGGIVEQQFAFKMIRNPDPPSISTTYDSGTGVLTFSERD